MITDIGYVSVLLALVVAVYAAVAAPLGAREGFPELVRSAKRAVYAAAGLVTLAVAVLAQALVGNDYGLRYAWQYASRDMAPPYKFSALYAGNDGSLLFWVWILSLLAAGAVFLNRRERTLSPYVIATTMTIAAFFLVLISLVANPFERLPVPQADGRGMNPMLENPGMLFHPPTLYLGYVGLAIPFAFMVAALVTGKLDGDWLRRARGWALFAWLMLGIGNVLGAQWAYVELGWGGYWAWDPVENASFLPWLTGTAFLHSVIIQEQRGILKVWNMVLIWLTYFLVILGTFTTRSGVLESVHSFARSDVGPYFLVFMIIIVFGFLWLLFKRLPLLRDEQTIESYASREAAFMGNNWLFTALAFATLWGTFFPMFSEIITGDRISVAAPFFNKVNGPLFLLLYILMGAAPLLAWRRTSLTALRNQFTWPLVAAAVVAAGVLFLTRSVWPVVGLAICGFVAATIVQEYVRGVRARRITNGDNVLVAMGNLWRRNGRRYGGYLVHLAMVMIAVAVIGNEFFQDTTNVTLGQGQTVTIGGYELAYTGLETNRAANRMEFGARLMVFDAESGRLLGTVLPQRNIYDKTPDMPTSEVGLRMTPLEDVYVLLNGWSNNGASATFTIYINPLTMWLWIGGIVLIIGTLIAIWPHPARRRMEAAQTVAAGAGVSV